MKTATAIIAAIIVIGGGIFLYNRYNTGTENDVNLNIGDTPIISPGTTTTDIVPGIDVDVSTTSTSSGTSTRGSTTTGGRAPAISDEIGR